MKKIETLTSLTLEYRAEILNHLAKAPAFTIDLIQPSEYEEEKNDSFFDLPRFMIYNKYNSYEEYAIVQLKGFGTNAKINTAIATGVSIDGETNEQEAQIDISDLELYSLALLCDTIDMRNG